MAIHVALNHRTEYLYDRPVNMAPHLIRLRPAPHTRTPILSYSLKVQPEEQFLNWQQDPQSNWMARLVFPEKARKLVVEVDLVAEMTVINPFDFFLEEYAEHFPFQYDPSLSEELAPFRKLGPVTPAFKKRLEKISTKKERVQDFLVRINQELNQEIGYTIRLEPGVQTPEQTLEKASGSCRDSAWLLVQLLRHKGFAARFVSGYLIQLVADIKSLDGPSGAEKDFTDLHAWVEVYLPGAGWVGLDPTSGLFTGEGHIPLAATPEPSSAAPISGAVDECETEFKFAMSVTRIHEDPRVTKPYTEEQWETISGLGNAVDERLKAQGLSLTMGGEPTFVSIDDMEGDEWNTAAVGPTKRRLAGNLVHRLRNRFAKGGLLHYGQGKWYPGEQLPRWALSCYWRKDELPIWQNDELIAKDDSNYGHDSALAETFITEFAGALGVNPDHCKPAYEDVYYYLWRESKLPINVDPFKSKLDDVEERERLFRIYSQGLSAVSGYMIPLMKGAFGHSGEWRSGQWVFRDNRLHLIPGDSPMGLRLPLNALPWVTDNERLYVEEADPTIPREPFNKSRFQEAELAYAEVGSTGITALYEQGQPKIAVGNSYVANGNGRSANSTTYNYTFEQQLPPEGDDTIRTALCVEPREGILHIFMPPVHLVDHYLELIAALEATAEKLNTPIRIEGYLPPHDSRLKVLKVTPDPGVIEVNVHPAENWDELVNITTGVYEDAFYTRLGTEKFMLDGRHSGTGGGNHIVIGAQTPLESPLLKRPDLLKSLVGYWINHPSLSYLFSGMFIGPTSQAPRVDEARHDSLYELGIAFEQLSADKKPQPWLVDRVLRDLLTDLTGNTHRAEFCIDKLYSPDSATGRLGLLELRAYEMPPHSRMSLTQALLLRSLIARFAEQPYEQPLVAWGTSLHDRFMLPHFIWQDFAEVIRETNQAGFELKAEWFLPHWEFRCPSFGSVTYESVNLELRQALEPWNVLGEESGTGGTARYVDSSVERVEVKAKGMINPRHILTCNGRRVPLHPTGVKGEFVAGVRFRAWQPPRCMHPYIPVQAPLVFDLYDTWSGRSLGGFTYHVKHPGGLSYETFPVNGNEAESRRFSRFFKFGHTPGAYKPQPEPVNYDFPFTLDLRRNS